MLETMIRQINPSELVLDLRARDWCKLPYPDHPNGCPNYNYRSNCPPQVCTLDNFIDLQHTIILVIQPFDLEAHIGRMMQLHPNWSLRQARCVLYWQNSVNKQLEQRCRSESERLPNSVYTTCPEAMGLNVIKTLQKLSIPIKTRPQQIVYKVGLVGTKKGVEYEFSI